MLYYGDSVTLCFWGMGRGGGLMLGALKGQCDMWYFLVCPIKIATYLWSPLYFLSESLLGFFGLLFFISTLISLFFPTSVLTDVYYSHKLLVFQVKNQAHQLVVLCNCQFTCQVATQSVKSIRRPSNSLWKKKGKMQEWKQKEGNWWKKE